MKILGLGSVVNIDGIEYTLFSINNTKSDGVLLYLKGSDGSYLKSDTSKMEKILGV